MKEASRPQISGRKDLGLERKKEKGLIFSLTVDLKVNWFSGFENKRIVIGF